MKYYVCEQRRRGSFPNLRASLHSPLGQTTENISDLASGWFLA